MLALSSFVRSLPAGWRQRLRPLLRFKAIRWIATSVLLDRSPDDEITQALEVRKPIDLVVHVGAHLGEESWLYEFLGASTVLWIEADPDTCVRLEKRMLDKPRSGTHHVIAQALISEEDGSELALRRYSNDGASSSIYSATDAFAAEWPGLEETGDVVPLRSHTLHSVLGNAGIELAMYSSRLLVIDVQGHELAVLRGATHSVVAQFDLVCVEVSMEKIYEGGADGREVIAWLARCGFRPISTIPHFHGDLLLERSGDNV